MGLYSEHPLYRDLKEREVIFLVMAKRTWPLLSKAALSFLFFCNVKERDHGDERPAAPYRRGPDQAGKQICRPRPQHAYKYIRSQNKAFSRVYEISYIDINHLYDLLLLYMF